MINKEELGSFFALDYYGQLLSLVVDEVNVKQFSLEVCGTEKGKLTLVYDKGFKTYLDDKEVKTSNKLKENILDNYFKP